MNRNGRDASYSVWTNGVATWLPKTDWIIFIDPATDSMGFAPWDGVLAELDDALQPLDYYPPRWSVDSFPATDQLARMGAVAWKK
jgi:hypothetical protein